MQTPVKLTTLGRPKLITTALNFEQISVLSDKDLEDLFVKPEDKPLSEKLATLFSLFPAIDKELKKKGNRWFCWLVTFVQ